MAAALLCAACAALEPDREGDPRGHLVIAGGGRTPLELCARVLELAGGFEVGIVVLPQASGREDRGAGSADMWRELGATDVVNLDGVEPDRAAERIAAAELIWIPGDGQTRFMEAWAGTPVPAAIRGAYRRGAVVGGTSAGAAAMSAVMITGKADLESIRAGQTVVAEGLGLWPDVIVDQHFLARRRGNRLIAAVLDRPHLVGIGIDEGTGVIVSPAGTLEVAGTSAVLVVDARAARVEPTEKGRPAAATGVVVHLLRDGMTFDLGGTPRDP